MESKLNIYISEPTYKRCASQRKVLISYQENNYVQIIVQVLSIWLKHISFQKFNSCNT